MRKKIVAGNWKMNKDYPESRSLFNEICSFQNYDDVEVIVFPPSLYLSEFAGKNSSNTQLGAQNLSDRDNGAFTGEISATMLKSMGIPYVLIGHSERRLYFNENNPKLKLKVEKALDSGLKVVYCCGESLEEREAGKHMDVINEQLKEVIYSLDKEKLKEIVIAYEPVWAIGTGKTASEEQAQEMHAHIRSQILDQFGDDIANEMRILYGGSCKPTNSEALFTQPDIDGGLIGGASLLAEDFKKIIESAHG